MTHPRPTQDPDSHSQPNSSRGNTGALHGVRVLDLSRVLAGPWATQLLGDLGADVIKIERPGAGDETRTWGPPWVSYPPGADSRVAAYYLCANRNKRSVTINMAEPKGADLIARLAAKSDVVVENFKVGGLARYHLDYAHLRKLNPRLIYCSITGFGQDGPYATRAGYDFLIQGLGGLMSITGRPDGEAGAGPMKVGVALTDVLTGLYAANAIQAALHARARTGEGQRIDMALLDVQVACLANQAMNYLATGNSPRRLGNGHPNIVPYQDFPTADGHMILAIGNDGQFERFCKEIGRPGLADDPRFKTNAARVNHRKELVPMLCAVTVSRTTDQWIAALDLCAVPCGPINNIAKVFDDPQVQSRGLRIDVPVPDATPVTLVGDPMRLSATPVGYELPPPTLGQHTEAVLSEVLGLTNVDIAKLRQSHAI